MKELYLILVLSIVTTAAAQIDPNAPQLKVSLTRDVVRDAVNLMAECGVFGFGWTSDGNHYDLAVHGDVGNTIEFLSNPDRILLDFDSGKFSHKPITAGILPTEVVGYNLLDLKLIVNPHVVRVANTPYYKLVIDNIEIDNVDIDNTCGWCENRLEENYDIDEIILLDNLYFGSEEILNHYGPPQLILTSDEIGMLFERLLNTPIERSVFVDVDIETDDYGVSSLSCEDLGVGQYSVQLNTGESWISVTTSETPPSGLVLNSGKVYRVRYENNADILYSLPRYARYSSLDGEFHVNSTEEFVSMARLIRSGVIYIDNDFIIDESVNMQFAEEVIIRGPAELTVGNNGKLIAPITAEVELRNVTFVAQNLLSTGVLLDGPFNTINSCVFDGFYRVLSHNSLMNLTLINTTTENCAYGVSSSNEMLIVNSDFEFAVDLGLIGERLFDAKYINCRFEYTPTQCSELNGAIVDIEANQLIDPIRVEFTNCEFIGGGVVKAKTLSGLCEMEFTDVRFHNRSEGESCGLQIVLSDGYDNCSDDNARLNVIFDGVQAENLELVDLDAYCKGRLEVLNTELRGVGHTGEGIKYPYGGTSVTSTTEIANSILLDLNIKGREARWGQPDAHQDVIRNSSVVALDSQTKIQFNQLSPVKVVNSILDIDCYSPFIHGAIAFMLGNNCLTDQEWGEDDLWESQGCFYAADPGFCHSEQGDFRLRYDSVCLDKSNELLNGQPVLEFDLTKKDLGWKPVLEELVIEDDGGTPRSTLVLTEPTNVHVQTEVVIDATSIPAGSTIKAAPGAYILLQGNGSMAIGDPDGGPRVSILGTDEPDGQSRCDGLVFEGVGSEPVLTSMKGVRFYGAPGASVNERALVLTNLDFGGMSHPIDPASVKFELYDEASLQFNNCQGRIQNFVGETAFGAQHVPGFVGLLNSSMDIVNCSFGAIGEGAGMGRLTISGMLSGGEDCSVHNCDFETSGNSNDPVNTLRLTNAAVDLRQSEFVRYLGSAVRMVDSNLYMRQGAANALEQGVSVNEPLIHLSGGLVDAFCGYNRFLKLNWQSGTQYFVQESDPGEPPVVQDWRNNAWGSSCASLESNTSAIQAKVPEWAQIVSPLNTCNAPLADCEDWLSNPLSMLKAGKEAETNGFPNVAHAYYRDLIWTLPTAKEVAEGTNRLKALGQKGVYGEDMYETVRDDLFAAADTSATFVGQETMHEQEVLQDSNGWLVEGYHGDRQAAKDALLAMKVAELQRLIPNVKCLNIINAAVLELETYPLNGGLLAADGLGRVRSMRNRSQAAHDLLFGGQTLTVEPMIETVLPQRLALVSCHPNPFNPVTTVRFDLPTAGDVKVLAYNVLGQQVALLHSGRLEAGRHDVRFDGSNLSSGMYLVRVDTPQDGSLTHKVMLVR